MRLLLFLLPLLLAGCPAAPPDAAKPAPPPANSPAPSAPAKTIPSAATPEYTGVWTTLDEQGQLLDILIFSNGQTVTTSTKGKNGAQGEQGFWRKEGNRLIAFYNDGTSGVFTPDDHGGFRYQAFSPGAALDAPTANSAPIQPVSDPAAKLTGIWQLNKEPDGDYLYIALQSNGRAFSSVNGGTEGKWIAKDDGAECTWPDGWVDRIEHSSQGWQKRSWIGTNSNAPADLSPAVRLGEARFSAAP